jgi:hypothetical protein
MWNKWLLFGSVACGVVAASRALADGETTYIGNIDFDSGVEMFYVTTTTQVVYIPYYHESLTEGLRHSLVVGATQGDADNEVTLDVQGNVLSVDFN